MYNKRTSCETSAHVLCIYDRCNYFSYKVTMRLRFISGHILASAAFNMM